MGKDLLADGMMDSGVGRTLSSYSRPKMRSRSEERMSTTPMMLNGGHGPMVSVRSEALSEPIVKHSSQVKYPNYRTKDNSVILDIPLPRSRMFPQNEQYGDYDAHDDSNKQKMEKHRRREKSVENRSADGTEETSAKLQVSPLNSNRLQPIRQRTKNAIFTILDNGEVCTEFIKRRHNMVCRRVIRNYK